MRRTIAALAIALLLAAGPGTHMAGPAAVLRAQPAVAVPTFEVDPAWPKLPSNLMFGEVSSVTVDRRDHIWVIQRPRTVPADQRDKAAPPVLEFDASGKYIKGFGGPSDAYEWPDNEHAIFVDGKDRVWIGGNAPQGTNPPRSDDMLLTFTNGGKFLRQIGRREKSTGNKGRHRPFQADVGCLQQRAARPACPGNSSRSGGTRCRSGFSPRPSAGSGRSRAAAVRYRPCDRGVEGRSRVRG
jgi:hypothetical protein